jgi:hypothetical protein
MLTDVESFNASRKDRETADDRVRFGNRATKPLLTRGPLHFVCRSYGARAEHCKNL